MKKLNFLKHMMLLLVGMTFAFNASAVVPNWQLHLYDHEGTRVGIYPCASNPHVTFTEDQVIVTTDVAEVYYYSLPDMWMFTYDAGTGITDIAADKDAMQFDGSVIIFPALKAGTDIAVYAANGSLVMNKQATTAGDYMFSLSELSQGVYMVNVNGKTYKIVKK